MESLGSQNLGKLTMESHLPALSWSKCATFVQNWPWRFGWSCPDPRNAALFFTLQSGLFLSKTGTGLLASTDRGQMVVDTRFCSSSSRTRLVQCRACGRTTAAPERERVLSMTMANDNAIPFLGHPAPLMQSSAVPSVRAHHMDCLVCLGSLGSLH